MTYALLTSPVLAAAAPTASHSEPRLIFAVLLSIGAIVLFITRLKLHPFLSLVFGSALLAVVAGVPIADLFTSFTTGMGSTVGGVGVLIALGAIIGKVLVDSGGAEKIVDTLIDRTNPRWLPWTMALIAFIVGIPLFFEVGVVLLMPIIVLVALRTRKPLMLIGIPALAGLSVLHGFVPPHPGPLIAIDAVHANLGLTLGLGLLVAIPTVIVAGPLLSRFVTRWVPLMSTDTDSGAAALAGIGGGQTGPGGAGGPGTQAQPEGRTRTVVRPDPAAPAGPSFAASLLVVLCPVVLMLAHAVAQAAMPAANPVTTVLEFVGTPLVALLIAAVLSLVVLGRAAGFDRARLSKTVDGSFGPIAGILLIVGAGGGFKQTLVDTGVADVVARHAAGWALSPLVIGWLVAVFIRLATGSATVATVTAAGMVAPLATGLSPTHAALLALAIGAGSLFLSHVNDAGFWLVKEYFGMTVGQTFRSWSLMECVISVVGLTVIMLLSLVL